MDRKASWRKRKSDWRVTDPQTGSPITNAVYGEVTAAAKWQTMVATERGSSCTVVTSHSCNLSLAMPDPCKVKGKRSTLTAYLSN